MKLLLLFWKDEIIILHKSIPSMIWTPIVGNVKETIIHTHKVKNNMVAHKFLIITMQKLNSLFTVNSSKLTLPT